MRSDRQGLRTPNTHVGSMTVAMADVRVARAASTSGKALYIIMWKYDGLDVYRIALR
jgi:hypothetical protein